MILLFLLLILFQRFRFTGGTQKIILDYLTKTLNLKTGDPLLQSIFQDLGNYMDEAIEKENSSKKGLSIPHGERFLTHHHLLTGSIKGSIGCKLGFSLHWPCKL